MSQKKSTRSPLLLAFITIFLDLLGFGIIIPIQPFFAETFGARATTVTILGASYSLMQFIFAPFWGRLSDKYGRRPIILMSVFFSIIGHALFGFASSLSWLFTARMVAGFGNANLGTAQAVVSDVTTAENRAKGMGVIGAAFGLGFIFGPAMGGILGQKYGPAVPSFLAAGLSALNFVLAYFLLPETLNKQNATKATSHGRRSIFDLASFKHAIKNANVGRMFAVTITYTIAFAMMEQVVGLLIESSWITPMGLSITDTAKKAAGYTGYFLIAVGVTATIVQGGLIGRISKKYHETTLIPIALFTIAVGLMSLPALAGQPSFGIFCISAVILAIGSGILNPSATSLLSKSVTPHEQGGTLGLNQSLSALGRVIGPASAGFLYEHSHWSPFLLGTALMLAAVSLATGLKKVAVVA